MRLSEIAKIHSGHLFRTRVEHNSSGNIAVVQAKDLQKDNSIGWDGLTVVDLKRFRDECIIRNEDILFRSRSQKFTATHIESLQKEAVASSQFYIIRVRGDKVLPSYLEWYINSERGQQYLNKHSAGTGVQHVNKTTLSELDVPLPSISTQNRIVELHRLGQKEQQLIDRIKDKRKMLIEAVLLKQVKQS